MHKGVSAILASVLILLVTISLSGAFLVYSQRTATQLTESGERQQQTFQQQFDSRFIIEGVDDSSIFIRNTGASDISYGDLSIFLDDILINYTLNVPITPGTTGTLYLNQTWKTGHGERTLRMASGAATDSVRVRVDRPAGSLLVWGFDEESGTTANDQSASGNPGVVLASGRNQIDNAGFERPFSGASPYVLPDRWFREGPTSGETGIISQETVLVQQGSSAVKMDLTASDGGDAFIGVQARNSDSSKYIPANASQTYTLSGWYYAQPGATTKPRLGILFYNSAGSAISTSTTASEWVISPVRGAWTRFEFATGVTPADTTKALVFLRANAGSAGDTGYVIFDAVQMEERSPATEFIDGPWTVGQVNGALDFDGLDDNVTTSTNIDLSNTSTWTAWVNPSSLPNGIAGGGPNDYQYRMVMGESNLQAGYYLGIIRTIPTNQPRFVVSYHRASDGAQTTYTGTTVPAVDTWYHVVVIHNGTAGSRLYVNGVLDGSVSVGVANPTAQKFIVGKWGGQTYPGYYVRSWNGGMDEVAIYANAYEPDELYVINRA